MAAAARKAPNGENRPGLSIVEDQKASTVENRAGLSIVEDQKASIVGTGKKLDFSKIGFVIARRNKKQSRLSIPDRRVVAIDRERAQAGISHNHLCQCARVHPSTWRAWRSGQQEPRPAQLERLKAAIVGRAAIARRETATLIALYRLIVMHLAQLAGEDASLMLAQDFSIERPQNAEWLKAARLRRMAMYVLAIEVEVDNANIGRALNCTRQNVKQARDDVEDLRADDAATDRALDHIGRLLRGAA